MNNSLFSLFLLLLANLLLFSQYGHCESRGGSAEDSVTKVKLPEMYGMIQKACNSESPTSQLDINIDINKRRNSEAKAQQVEPIDLDIDTIRPFLNMIKSSTPKDSSKFTRVFKDNHINHNCSQFTVDKNNPELKKIIICEFKKNPSKYAIFNFGKNNGENTYYGNETCDNYEIKGNYFLCYGRKSDLKTSLSLISAFDISPTAPFNNICSTEKTTAKGALSTGDPSTTVK